MSYQDIPGWSCDIEPFYRWVSHRIPQGGTFVEVGVFCGRSLACMGELRPDVDLWALDQWQDGSSQGYLGTGEHTDAIAPHGSLWFAFLHMMKANAPEVLQRTHVVRAKSTHFARGADFVFIDAAHDYESVRADILHWRSLVNPGGILAGHDYDPQNANQDNLDVVRAVDELLPHRKIGPPGTDGWSSCWWIEC